MTFLEKWIKESEPIWNMQCELLRFVRDTLGLGTAMRYWDYIAEIETEEEKIKFLKENDLYEVYQFKKLKLEKEQKKCIKK